jgi:ubiquinone/menaquinone biosynthesis C-methylase UbiE
MLISFLEKFRRLTEDPMERLTEIGLKKGMTFLDLGCTLGFYSFPAASIVGEEGLVYALDVNSDFIEYVACKAKNREIRHIETIVAYAQNTGLSPESVDIVFLHLVFHDIEDKRKAIREFNRILKANGKLVIDEENVVPLDAIRKLVEETGFRISKTLRKTIQIFAKTQIKPDDS